MVSFSIIFSREYLVYLGSKGLFLFLQSNVKCRGKSAATDLPSAFAVIQIEKRKKI